MPDQLPPPSNLTGEDEFNKYTSTNRIEQWLVDNFMRTLEGVLPDREVTSVLEIGVGEGHVSERVVDRFPDAEVVGVDLPHPGHEEALQASWAERGITGVFADATDLPFEDDRFDLVLAIEVLEHMPAPEQALAELARVGRGDAILSVPLEPLWRIGNMVRGRYLADWGNTPDHIQHWTRRGFTSMVGDHLEVRSVRNPLPWTLVVASVPT